MGPVLLLLLWGFEAPLPFLLAMAFGLAFSLGKGDHSNLCFALEDVVGNTGARTCLPTCPPLSSPVLTCRILRSHHCSGDDSPRGCEMGKWTKIRKYPFEMYVMSSQHCPWDYLVRRDESTTSGLWQDWSRGVNHLKDCYKIRMKERLSLRTNHDYERMMLPTGLELWLRER